MKYYQVVWESHDCTYRRAFINIEEAYEYARAVITVHGVAIKIVGWTETMPSDNVKEETK